MPPLDRSYRNLPPEEKRENQELNRQLTAKMREIRTSLGYSREAWAKLAKVGATTVTEWETNGRAMPAHAFVNLSRALKVTVEFFFDGIAYTDEE